MPGSDELQEIFRRSLDELRAIAAWLDSQEQSRKIGPVTVLIGGWAVYAYNPWYGSIDIDLITNSDVKNRLMRHLTAARQYSRDAGEPPSTVVKYVKIGEITVEIRLDFISRSSNYPFEGTDKQLSFGSLDRHTILKEIGDGLSFRVPERSLLLIYKLKAISDRSYRLKSGRSTFPERETDKLEKDYCDVLALIDRKQYRDDLDIGLLAEEMSRYDFLQSIIKELPDNARAIDRYKRLKQDEAASVCEDLLLLIKK
ncbi:MAG: hypothetical protein WBZ29_13550 [Methanocella sp.]